MKIFQMVFILKRMILLLVQNITIDVQGAVMRSADGHSVATSYKRVLVAGRMVKKN